MKKINFANIISYYDGNGGLDLHFINRQARAEGISTIAYIRAMVKNEFECSWYLANKVAHWYGE